MKYGFTAALQQKRTVAMKRFSFGVRPCRQKEAAATGSGFKEMNTEAPADGPEGGKKPYRAKENGDVQAETPRISAFFWCAFIALFPVAGLAYLIVRAMYEKNSSMRNMARALLLLRGAVLFFGTASVLGAIYLLDAII